MHGEGWYNEPCMNKESVVAIILGLVLGIGVAGGAVFVTVKDQREKNAKMSEIVEPEGVTVAPTVTVLKTLKITSPVSGYLTRDNSVQIKGSMSAESLLILQSPTKTTVNRIKADDFVFTHPLSLGENVITISAYQKGTAVPIQQKIYVYRISE
jgi:hypothetical protein